jgi:IS605 OrfB family transposase
VFITDVITVPVRTGFFADDQAAIRGGASHDGFTYSGEPVTPGFKTVRQAGEAVSVLLVLDDGQVAHGDCAAVVTAIAIEDLDFTDAKAACRENLGRAKKARRFRRTLHGLPTARFRDRLVQMAANAGLHVIAVDPAYTSRWGGQHRQAPLQQQYPHQQISRHHAASVTIARRAQGHKARRRAGVTFPHQSDEEQRATAQATPENPRQRGNPSSQRRPSISTKRTRLASGERPTTGNQEPDNRSRGSEERRIPTAT